MRVLTLFNQRRVWGGEDRMVESITAILEEHGDTVLQWIRSNAELGAGFGGKLRAFSTGFYSRAAARDLHDRICSLQPDVVHAHNIYPLFSPSVAVACRRLSVPFVQHVHSFFLTCPTTFHLRDGQVCNRCAGGREYACVLHNCRGNLFESAAYAARTAVTRKLRLLKDNVTRFITVSQFCRRWLIEQDYPADRIAVVPNTVSIPAAAADPTRGEYAAFVGRLSVEKGFDTLFEAARRSGVPLWVAADTSDAERIIATAPANVRFVGRLDRAQLAAFYAGARFAVVPSIWWEPFGLVAAEAMAHGLPVIASRIGALPEIVDEEQTGVLVEPNDSDALSTQMLRVWGDSSLRRSFGTAGRRKAVREYAPAVYYQRLMRAYRAALEAFSPGDTARSSIKPTVSLS
jgi:glycosyltransferase involved in cell wall biosynthesis